MEEQSRLWEEFKLNKAQLDHAREYIGDERRKSYSEIAALLCKTQSIYQQYKNSIPKQKTLFE